MKSDLRQERVAAFKFIHNNEIEISRFPSYRKIISSPDIPERYWLVRALGSSRTPETFRLLVNFLDDPHPNVICQAFFALGKRGNKEAVMVILEKIKTSRNWYCQWYAYKALRKLGWIQQKLK
jgi:HEAT repeat protein